MNAETRITATTMQIVKTLRGHITALVVMGLLEMVLLVTVRITTVAEIDECTKAIKTALHFLTDFRARNVCAAN